MVNANNKGYARVLMTEEELRFFGNELEKLDAVNRCYMWFILFDHVKMGMLSIEDFWHVVLTKFREETNEDVVLFLLEKISWLLRCGFIDADLMKVGTLSDTQGAKLGPFIDQILMEKIFDPSTHKSLQT